MHKKLVKISHPRRNPGFQEAGIIGQTPGGSGVWGEYRFEVNSEATSCDYWVVIESVDRTERMEVPPGHTFFVPCEEIPMRTYSPEYLAQFDRVITSRADINGPHVIKTHFFIPWFVKRTYDELKAEGPLTKTRLLSTVTSDTCLLTGHRERYAFINKMMGHFKDRLDAFGKGVGYIDDKYDALAPYKYSIVIENALPIYNYWSEKLADCYLGQTMPIYAGCPNVTDYFPADSLIRIDIRDYRACIRTIEEAIAADTYERSLPAILEARAKVLDEYQLFPYLVRAFEDGGGTADAAAGSRPKEIQPLVGGTNSRRIADLRDELEALTGEWRSGTPAAAQP